MADTKKKNQTKQPAAKGNQKAPAKQGSQQGKQAKQNEEAANRMTRQRQAIIIVAVAFLLGCLAFIEGESGWSACRDIYFRIFGVCSYLIPFALVYIGIVCAKDRPDTSMSSNVLSASGFLLFISAAFHIFRQTKDYFTDTGIAAQVSDVWNKNPDVWGSRTNGGIIGALLGGSICKVIGRTGTGIIIVVLLIVFLLLVTGTTLPLLYSYVRKPVRKAADAASERFEQNALRREEAREQREKEEEERRNRKPPEAPDSNGNTPKSSGHTPAGLAEPEMPKTGAKPVDIPAPAVPAPVDGNPDGSLIPAVELKEAISNIPVQEEKPQPKPRVKKPRLDVEKTEEKKEPEPEDKFTPPEPEAKKNGRYIFPSIECLDKRDTSNASNSEEEMRIGAEKLIDTLRSFKINATITNICRGPSVTRYELLPEAGVRISKITTLSDDIALRLAAQSVRIEAPIPGKSAIGIEVPNSAKSMVSMREIIDTDQYRAGALKSKLSVALGKDITGNIIIADLAKMPHLLVAGTTGSGKSVCLNSMIISILYNASPDEVKLLMIDPKQVEFTVYNGIAHLAVPVVSNPRKAAGALSWAVSEMEKRYAQFAATGCRDIKGFNKLAEEKRQNENGETLQKMHHIVIFIDELSDLMMASPKEVEDSICRLAQMARAAGIHLVIATQRPSVDVITGIIKANIPSRIALFVSSNTDSRTILDQGGAEKLLGNGDMLFNPVGSSKPTRVQGCFISDEEVEAVVNHIKSQTNAEYDDSIMQEIEAKAASVDGGKGGRAEDDEDSDLDPMFNEAAEVVILAGQASTTMLQKKLKLGYARASRVMDELEENGIVGPAQGAKPREVLVSKQEWYERQALAGGHSSGSDEQLSFDTVPSFPSKADEENEAYEEYEEDEEETEEYYEDEPEEEPEEDEAPDEFEDIYSDSSLDDGNEDDDPEEVPWEEEADEAGEAVEETYYEKDEDNSDDYPVYEAEYEEVYDDDEDDEEDRPVSVDDIFDDDDNEEDEDIDSFFN